MMEGLSVEERATLAAYWFRRSEGELTSYVGFQHVLDDLRAEGSPASICELAERAVDEEYQHAVSCRDWALRFGHPEAVVTRPRGTEPLRFAGASERENRLLRIVLCCFTETAGCFILRHVREVIQDPELRRFNQRHLAEEVQHTRVGWGHLATFTPATREVVEPWVPKLLEALRQVACEGPELDREELVPFGYFTPRVLRDAHDEALRDVILPGLAHVGLRTNA